MSKRIYNTEHFTIFDEGDEVFRAKVNYMSGSFLVEQFKVENRNATRRPGDATPMRFGGWRAIGDRTRNLPPGQVHSQARVENILVGPGGIVEAGVQADNSVILGHVRSGAHVSRSEVGAGSKIEEEARVIDSRIVDAVIVCKGIIVNSSSVWGPLPGSDEPLYVTENLNGRSIHSPGRRPSLDELPLPPRDASIADSSSRFILGLKIVRRCLFGPRNRKE